MNCNAVRTRLAALDRYDPLPDPVRIHLQQCRSCRELWARLREIEAAGFSAGEADSRMVDLVMQRIEESDVDDNRQACEEIETTRPVAWIFGGLLLPVALIAIRFSRTFQYLLDSPLGERVDLSVTLAIGITLSMYMAVLVTGNARRLQRVVYRYLPNRDDGCN